MQSLAADRRANIKLWERPVDDDGIECVGAGVHRPCWNFRAMAGLNRETSVTFIGESLNRAQALGERLQHRVTPTGWRVCRNFLIRLLVCACKVLHARVGRRNILADCDHEFDFLTILQFLSREVMQPSQLLRGVGLREDPFGHVSK